MHKLLAALLLLAVFTTPMTTLKAQEETDRPPARDTPARDAELVEFLFDALHNRDESIRREAFRRLQQNEDLPITPRLVDALLHADQGTACRAVSALVGRLDYLRRAADRPGPRIKLLDEDQTHLQPVRALIDAGNTEFWRWYLAVWTIEQLDADSLSRHIPALIEAVYAAQPMRQYAAARALKVVAADCGDDARSALLAALRQRGRPKFVGVYLRYNRTIERNAVAYSADVWAPIAGSAELQYYAADDLLLCDALLAMDAGFAEIGGPLTVMSRHDNESVRLQAARQLVRLGPDGARAADAALARLLLDRRSGLVRQLADENAPTRDEAIGLLVGLGSEARAVVSPLAALLDSGEDRLRQSTAIVLGELGRVAAGAAPALERAIRMESLIADEKTFISPESLARAQQRLQDMQQALEKIQAAGGDGP